MVLNDRQRVAKRKLIEENREKRKTELIRMHMKHTSCDVDMYTDADKNLIKEIESAYETLIAKTNSNQVSQFTTPLVISTLKLQNLQYVIV